MAAFAESVFVKLHKRSKNGMTNARVQQIIFSTQHDFQTCFDRKNAYLQLMTSIIYRLDIALAAPQKNRLIFLMSAKNGRETTN